MNAALSILARPERVSAISKPRGASASIAAKASYGWSAEEFAEEQVQSLVQQLFYVGAPRPARQVVLSGILADQRTGSLCVKIGRTLAGSGAFNVCVVEADLRTRSMQIEFGGTSTDGRDTPDLAGAVRKSSLQLSDHLWLVPAEVFARDVNDVCSLAWLRGKLGALRREFDYAVIHAPAFGSGTETSVLSHAADGLVLVVAANRTRRIAVETVRESLKHSNIRLLGAVLSERTFPIPQSLYRRL